MADITSDFLSIIKLKDDVRQRHDGTARGSGKYESTSSTTSEVETYRAFMKDSIGLLGELRTLETLLSSSYSQYVDPHRFLRNRSNRSNLDNRKSNSIGICDNIGDASSVSSIEVIHSTSHHEGEGGLIVKSYEIWGEIEIESFECKVKQLLAQFMVSLSGKLRRLQGEVLGIQRKCFCKEVYAFLLNRLQESEKRFSRMKNDRARLNTNPFRIGTMTRNSRRPMMGSLDATTISTSSNNGINSKSNSNSSSNGNSNSNSDSNIDGNQNIIEKLRNDAIPLSKKMEYNKQVNVYIKNKKKLMEGSDRVLDDPHANAGLSLPIEQKVEDIGELFNKMLSIMNEQSNAVDEIYDTSNTTLENSINAEAQLVSAVKRSEGSQWTILISAISIAVLLLAIDFVTP